MNKEEKTELIEKCIYQTLKELQQRYKDEIHVIADVDYLNGKILIKVMD